MVEFFVCIISVGVVPDVSIVIIRGHFYDDPVFVVLKQLEEIRVEIRGEKVLGALFVLCTWVNMISDDEFA